MHAFTLSPASDCFFALDDLSKFICIIIFSVLLYPSRYIAENYSKIRDVEKEFANLSMEMKLTAGPKKAGS